MPPESASSRQLYKDILDQLPSQNRTELEAARGQLAEHPQPQGQQVGLEQAGQLPVGSTPNAAAKDLVHKYGRESSPSIERVPALEPEP